MSLDVAGVCRIIEACGQAGVTSLRFGELEVELGGKAIPPEQLAPEEPIAEQEIVAEEIARSEIAVKEDRVSNLLLEDPAQYEEMLAQGEFTDDDGREEEKDD